MFTKNFSMARRISVGVGLILILLAAISAFAQVSTLSIDRAVIAPGGGLTWEGLFLVEGTIGQPAVGSEMFGGGFSLSPGFWNADLLPPTAAGVSVSGRVLVDGGGGLSGAKVTCTDSAGNIRTARTGSFGYFSFSDIPAGETYFLVVEAKGYVFTPRAISVVENVTGVEFFPEQ
jgi:hypothetical protein